MATLIRTYLNTFLTSITFIPICLTFCQCLYIPTCTSNHQMKWLLTSLSDISFYSYYNRKNETCNFQKRNEQIFSFFASFFLLLFRPLKHQLKADFKPLKQA